MIMVQQNLKRSIQEKTLLINQDIEYICSRYSGKFMYQPPCRECYKDRRCGVQHERISWMTATRQIG